MKGERTKKRRKSPFRFSWFVLIYAIFAILHYDSEQEKKERDAAFYHTRQEQHKQRLQEDRRGTGPPVHIRQGVLPDDSLERMYDRNYMDHQYHEYNMDDDDEWHDYFND